MSQADSITPSDLSEEETEEWIAENQDRLENLATDDTEFGQLVDGLLDRYLGGQR